MNKDCINRIVKWNIERNLHKKKFDLTVESLNILEELLELINSNKSINHRELAVEVLDIIHSKLEPNASTNDREVIEERLNALADIIIFATGAILKMGYNPICILDETLKEIESRTGKIVNGKFIKDISEEAKSKWYSYDYSKCKNKSRLEEWIEKRFNRID